MAVSGGAPITVVMVDDHPIFREGVRRILAQQPDMRLVGEGWVGDHVEKLVREHQPNVLLLDLKMRQTDQPQSSRNVFKALPTIFRLHQTFPNLSIIVLSAHLSLPLIEGAFEKGVRGYLLKDDIDPPSLPGAIHAVCRGRLRFSGAVEEFMKQVERRGPRTSPLSRRQKEVILTVATNLDTPLYVHAETLGITEATLRNHLSNIFHELQVTNLAACVVRCIQMDIIPLDQEMLS